MYLPGSARRRRVTSLHDLKFTGGINQKKVYIHIQMTVCCWTVDLHTDLCAVGSGGAVGLLLLDLLQLLFVHQGQLLLMLLVLFNCES